MTTVKPTKTNATEEDRLRRDEILMKKLRIFHEPETTSDDWPSFLKNTFQIIATLGSFQYQTYDDKVPARHSTSTWRREIKLRAKQLSDTARRLLKDKPSELTWRLELEKLDDARFNLRTECKTCSGPGRSGRLWRSKIEVVTEINGDIAQDLRLRRKTRVPCKCLDVVYSGLNPLFSNRADQVFSYDPHFMNHSEKEGNGNGGNKKERNLPERRPDRVYGLCQTSNFEERLGSPAKGILDDASEYALTALQKTIDPNGEELVVQDFLHATPFHQRGEPLLFPFLILEAKTEESRGHRNCGIQTSLPIWGLLQAQERLLELSCPMEELGGPLVWYISYLGDSWRISGCYIKTERAQKTYQIRDLWNGRISSPDGALQVLLIMDYIFDWARDLYRPSILHCLGAMNHALDDGMSFVADSDINSTRQTYRLDTPTEVESFSDSEALETLVSDESLLESWKKYDIRNFHAVVEYNLRSFRPSYIVKSAFQCLYLTRDNMRSAIDCLGNSPPKHAKMARDALQALRKGPMIVSQRVLSQIEHTWTGTIRESHRVAAGDEIFCSIVHTVSMPPMTWELTRTIFCLALDQDALNRIRQYAALKRKTYRLEGMEQTAPTIDEETVATILGHLKNRKSQDLLALALANVSDIWKPMNMLSNQERRQLGHEARQLVVLEPLVHGCHPMKKLVQAIYRRHKPGGLLLPDAPCLRFSAQLERLEASIIANPPLSLPLYGKQSLPTIPENGAILVCDKYRDENHLCIYVTQDNGDPSQWTELTQKLATSISKKQFFIVQRYSWNPEGKCLTYNPTVEPEEILFPLIKTAAQLWGVALYRKYIKEYKTDDLPDIFEYDQGYRQELWDMRDKPFSGEPKRLRSNKRPRYIPNNRIAEGTPCDSTEVIDSSTADSDAAEIKALLGKWGLVRFTNALPNMEEISKCSF